VGPMSASLPLRITSVEGIPLPEPDPAMAAALLAAGMAANSQTTLVKRNLRTQLEQRASRIVATACSLIQVPMVWEAPASASVGNDLLYEFIFPLRARLRCQRVVRDSLITAEEAAYFAHEALHRFGDPMLGDEEASLEDAGESGRAVAWPDWADHPLNDRVRFLICEAVRLHFGETRPLHLAGALLTRKTSANAPSPPHVDKANIGYYDYSAVLYLSTQGEDFTGGEFTFTDRDGDEVVQPRVGRCVLFSSGTEHLHQVAPVSSGVRHALGMWLTLTEQCMAVVTGS